MGLQETFQKMAQTVFSAFGNVATAATYTSVGTKTYNTDTGAVTGTDTYYAVNIIFTTYESREIDNQVILATDQKGLIPTQNLTPEPKIIDVITKNNQNWQVISFGKDPTNALWTFQLRLAS